MPIDTRLDANRTGLRSPAEVASLIASMDVVLTTRLHGMVLALRNGIPAVAVDAIAGGSKVKRQAEAVGWPVVFTADALGNEELNEAFGYCLTEEARAKARECCARPREHVEETGDEFLRALAAQVTSFQEHREGYEWVATIVGATRRWNVMSEGRSPDVRPMVFNVEKILDAHTHLTGQESPEQILECMNACAVEKAFLFAPELDVKSRHLTNDNIEDIRKHNDYCADVCSAAPDRLLGFCNLIPTPNIANGDLDRAVDMMVEEVHRCYHELGLRGAGELVPTRWYPNDPRLLPLWETLAELGMYTVYHTGIFYDGRESSYCRPTYFEVIHQVPGFKGHLAHVGWPWHDECIAVLNIGSQFMQMDPEEWGFKVDLSFGAPTDWQLEVWQRSIDTLPTGMLLYASDVFWPCEPEQYREKYLQPQLGLFETATTLGHIVEEGSPAREEYRNMIFFQNAYSHWQDAVKQPQDPRSASGAIEMPNALQEHSPW